MTPSFFSIRKIISYTIKILFALFLSTGISLLKLDFIESYLYDFRVRIKANLNLSKVNSKNIVIIYITPNTVKKFKGHPSFLAHKQFLENLSKYNPKFIVYDFRQEDGLPINIQGSDLEKFKFADIAEKLPNLHFITGNLRMSGEVNSFAMKYPLEKVNVSSCPISSDSKVFAGDGVYRRILISYQGVKPLHPILASYYNPEIEDINKIKGIFNFLDSTQAYINFHPNGSFDEYSFEDIYENKLTENLLKDKLVIVGSNTGKYPKDYVTTPYSREITAMSTTELHANIFQTLIENKAPYKFPKYVTILITILISLFTLYVVLALKPSNGLLIISSTFIFILTSGTILLARFNIWIDMAHPLLTIFLCYYFFIPYRLIIENRRSWEYIQKNKLLQQVEELKTNFISMMSHDLKTPIARIQGMTEVILKDNVTLSPNQREAVDTIKGSSDDLLKFINSILQYGRIESNGVELHKQSKDVNKVLEEVIKKHEFLAKVKKIKIETALEPLFPIQIDVDLMKQVFSNLVENAIKYSHEESTVTVKSREEGSNVIIEVSDNGMGIPAEDLPNIFMKFYRSHNVKTSTIKGSGLGLYLAQYFTRLHSGEISVESETGKGTTFKVTLPS